MAAPRLYTGDDEYGGNSDHMLIGGADSVSRGIEDDEMILVTPPSTRE